MVDDRRKSSNNANGQQHGENRREIVPLRLAEEIISYDTLSAVKHLERLAESGECLGIAFGAILRGGQVAHGLTGAAIDQPLVAVGLLSKVISNIQNNAYSEQ